MAQDDKSPRPKLLVLAVLLIALIPAAAWFSFNYINPQQRNMRAVEEYLESLQPELDQLRRDEPGLESVEFMVSTSENGSLVVMGVIEDEALRDRLRQFVADHPPPRPVSYYLDAKPTSEERAAP